MITTTCVDRLGSGVTDGRRSSELSLIGEDREEVELLDDMVVLDRASVDIEVANAKLVEVAVENVVEMEEDF